MNTTQKYTIQIEEIFEANGDDFLNQKTRIHVWLENGEKKLYEHNKMYPVKYKDYDKDYIEAHKLDNLRSIGYDLMRLIQSIEDKRGES
jgi:hypothetical protein